MTRNAGEVAHYLGAVVQGDERLEVAGVASPERAQAEDLIYLHSPRHLDRAERSAARCVLATPGTRLPGKTILEVKDPKFAFAKAAAWLFSRPKPLAVMHPTAIVPPSARVGANVSIGANTVIEPFCFLGRGVRVGENCWLHPRVTLYAGVQLGNRVEIHSGAVLG